MSIQHQATTVHTSLSVTASHYKAGSSLGDLLAFWRGQPMLPFGFAIILRLFALSNEALIIQAE